MKRKTIDCFYKPAVPRAASVENPSPTNMETIDQDNLQAEQQRIVTTAFERDSDLLALCVSLDPRLDSFDMEKLLEAIIILFT
ncbi:hypothetical protein E2562_000330 [Oryza meyeriana var. granulata]|uniref:Uncharacterized protein n=1 Tax=Oryza meyeriana var. granulata TaxID=110450 RepID=A0A6G1CBQ7_9ORYZ|nr:hypothetical protein E2562_000330 [Oryza meyeriana var. granulata]